ncbi:thermonuclease family protein [Polaromonas sp.]|uniref:thermonuclease family protein n=1 Tax=Polaromonas sp. TaxID=1869339 RepID=UPI00352BB3C8
MNKRYRKLVGGLLLSATLLIGGTSLLAFGSAQAQAEAALPVTVIRVLDGDTVEVAGHSGTIRLASLDAPEAAHGFGKPGQPFSMAATEYLRAQLINVPGVTMICVDRDTKYGRDVCELFRNGRSINRQLVAVGLAWANTSARGRYLRDKQLIGIQEQARVAKKGLWAQDSARAPATPPWEWRDQCWRQGVCLVPQQ